VKLKIFTTRHVLLFWSGVLWFYWAASQPGKHRHFGLVCRHVTNGKVVLNMNTITCMDIDFEVAEIDFGGIQATGIIKCPFTKDGKWPTCCCCCCTCCCSTTNNDCTNVYVNALSC